MASFTAIMHKDGEERENTLSFNPLLAGWKYAYTNCCEVHFTKDGVRAMVGKHMVFKKGINVLRVCAVPENQLQFLIKSHGINGIS